MPIKFLDLAAQNREVWDQVAEYHARIHSGCAYIGGPHVAEFETHLASFVGTKHAAAVASGTDALRLALLALDIGPGDEVITVAMTFVATAAAVLQTGARPVFVDVDPDTGNMSVEALARYLERGRFSTPRGPRAILPVHLYGLPAPMEQIMEVARRFSLPVVEDACQAHGARLFSAGRWRQAGSIGTIGCFSFYPGKNLGAWGDGGAITTDDPALAKRISQLRDHGRLSHYIHHEVGFTSRLDSLQAAVLSVKLKRLAQWNLRRRTIARRYSELLAESGVGLPTEPEGTESCYHLFVIRSPQRDEIHEALKRATIGCGIHYPVPVHLQPAFGKLGYRDGDLPASEQLASNVLSLPMHPHLSDTEVRTVARVVSEAVAA